MLTSANDCRCCGRLIPLAVGRFVTVWCRDCRAHLIDGDGMKPGQRTYEAQFGAPCPFTVNEDAPPDGVRNTRGGGGDGEVRSV